jgi:hypothetical protein
VLNIGDGYDEETMSDLDERMKVLVKLQDVLANTFDVHIRDERDGGLHVLMAPELAAIRAAVDRAIDAATMASALKPFNLD